MFESRIHAYLRASAGTRARRLGQFLLLFDEHDSGHYFNYAVPDDGVEPTPDEVKTLITAFQDRSRVPRLEYLPAMCPALEPTLVASGFRVEARVPILTCPPERALACAADGVTVRLATSHDELGHAAAVQGDAYAQPLVTEHDTARLRQVIDRGGLVALAVEEVSGTAVGAGQLGPPHPPRNHDPANGHTSKRPELAEKPDGISELAAVGVRASYRRRGIAAAVAAKLTRSAVAAGVALPFLMTTGDAEERVYRRIGYRRSAEMLHISLP